MTTTLTTTDARRNLPRLIKQVNDDRDTVHIASRSGAAVLVSEAEWNSLVETDYLLRSPANAKRLLDSLAQARRGEVEEHDLIDVD